MSIYSESIDDKIKFFQNLEADTKFRLEVFSNLLGDQKVPISNQTNHSIKLIQSILSILQAVKDGDESCSTEIIDKSISLSIENNKAHNRSLAFNLIQEQTPMMSMIINDAISAPEFIDKISLTLTKLSMSSINLGVDLALSGKLKKSESDLDANSLINKALEDFKVTKNITDFMTATIMEMYGIFATQMLPEILENIISNVRATQNKSS